MKPRTTIFIAISLLLIAGIVVLFKHKENAGSPANSTAAANASGRTEALEDSAKGGGSRRERTAPHSNAEMSAKLEAARIGRNHMVELWVKSAASTFEKTSQNLAADLGLSAEQAVKVDALFTSRKDQLAGMLTSLISDEAQDPHDTLRRITALMRNKGLREGLAGILTSAQLESFDAAEENSRREAIKARINRDFDSVNAVLTLTDPQKQTVLAALSASAAGKVEEEADARAFMSLSYGEMASIMDLSNLRGLAGALDPDLDDVPNFTAGSAEYHDWMEKQRAERIEIELSPLRSVLDGNQIARYREHLEKELPR